jgi:hypothetical protein
MENPRVPEVIEALRLHGDLLITFDDGKCAVYPATLLYGLFDHADEVIDLDSTDQNLPAG